MKELRKLRVIGVSSVGLLVVFLMVFVKGLVALVETPPLGVLLMVLALCMVYLFHRVSGYVFPKLEQLVREERVEQKLWVFDFVRNGRITEKMCEECGFPLLEKAGIFLCLVCELDDKT